MRQSFQNSEFETSDLLSVLISFLANRKAILDTGVEHINCAELQVFSSYEMMTELRAQHFLKSIAEYERLG